MQTPINYSQAFEKLGFYSAGIALFTLVVAMLYTPMSHKIMFGRLQRDGETRVATPGRRFAYFLLFPLVSFAFFLVMVASLQFLSSVASASGPSAFSLGTEDVLTISMAVVLAIRLTAYVNENAAEELGKILPLGLLGVFLVLNPDATFSEAMKRGSDLLNYLNLGAVFFLVIVLVEFTLRGFYAAFHMKPKKRPAPATRPAPPRPK